MKFALIAALLITFPALIALIYSLITRNFALAAAACVSLGLNTLPFLAAGFFMRARGDKDGHGPDIAH